MPIGRPYSEVGQNDEQVEWHRIVQIHEENSSVLLEVFPRRRRRQRERTGEAREATHLGGVDGGAALHGGRAGDQRADRQLLVCVTVVNWQ